MRVIALLTIAVLGKKVDDDHLATLKAKDDVKDLGGGLLYKVVNRGTGTEHPAAGTKCSVHYEGQLLTDFMDGSTKTFDSSYARGSPTEFAPNQVIKGWTLMLQRMVEGDKVEVYLPPSFGYGERGAGGAIPGDAALKFTIELLKIKGGAKKPKGEEL